MKKISKKYLALDKKEAEQTVKILSNYYPDAKCSLDFKTPYELLISLILAAQCTDKRVNEVMPTFIKTFKDVQTVANSTPSEIIKIIKPCGYYNSKAISIIEASKTIVKNYNSSVPNTMKDLLTLRGIGRKSANIILQECFEKTEGIAVDTHVTRISRKIGFSNGSTQIQIEKDLMDLFDKKYYSKLNHVLVYHGRSICIANHAKCDICPINTICKKNN